MLGIALPNHRMIVSITTWLFLSIVSAILVSAQTPRQIAQTAYRPVVLVVMENEKEQEISFGSGFFVQNGVIATNFHVIEGASKGYAKLIGQSKKYDIKQIVGIDRDHDLALLRLSGGTASSLILGDSKLVAVGDPVYVVGNPQGFEGTFSDGLVSGIRQIGLTTLFQITAPISPGSSGGPVLNAMGNVIGVAVGSFKGGGQNLNFAIPGFYLSALMSTLPPADTLPRLTRPESRPTEMGIGRYRDNGDGTITDTQTNLMWADRDNGSDIDWPNAKSYATNYTAGGYRNWRLPSVSELRDLVDINLSPSDTTCKLPNGIHAVRRVPAPLFLSCPFLWSEETRGVLAGRVVMSDGSLSWLHQGNRPLYRVLPVRSRE